MIEFLKECVNRLYRCWVAIPETYLDDGPSLEEQKRKFRRRPYRRIQIKAVIVAMCVWVLGLVVLTTVGILVGQSTVPRVEGAVFAVASFIPIWIIPAAILASAGFGITIK